MYIQFPHPLNTIITKCNDEHNKASVMNLYTANQPWHARKFCFIKSKFINSGEKKRAIFVSLSCTHEKLNT